MDPYSTGPERSFCGLWKTIGSTARAAVRPVKDTLSSIFDKVTTDFQGLLGTCREYAPQECGNALLLLL